MQKELGQNPAISTSYLVNNQFLFWIILDLVYAPNSSAIIHLIFFSVPVNN